MVIATLVIGAFGLSVPAHAQQQAGQEIKQKVTKQTMALAAHTIVRYQGAPKFVWVEETSISYAINTPVEVISFGSVFYLNMQTCGLSLRMLRGLGYRPGRFPR